MSPMTGRWSIGLLAIAVVMFAAAPLLIAQAPYEATMGLVAKIVYFHVPVWFVMFLAIFVCGISSGIYLFGSARRRIGWRCPRPSWRCCSGRWD